jgi:hypothetical protein
VAVSRELPGVQLVGDTYLNEDGSLYSVPVAWWPSGHVMYRWLNTSSRRPLFDLMRKGAVHPASIYDNSLLGLRHEINATTVSEGWYTRELNPSRSEPLDDLAPGEAKWFAEQLGLTFVPAQHAMMAVVGILVDVLQSEPLPGQMLEIDPTELEVYTLLGQTNPLLWPSPQFLSWAQERWP